MQEAFFLGVGGGGTYFPRFLENFTQPSISVVSVDICNASL